MSAKQNIPERDFPGSRWLKTDFHAHTPASDYYGRGDKTVPLSTTAEVWLQHAMEAELDCVVVTDHNSGDWIDILSAQYQELLLTDSSDRPEWFREIALFPGVEVTVREGDSRIPVLAIFDIASGREAIVSFLGKCEIFSRHGDASNDIVARDLAQVTAVIRKMGGIAVPARLDEEEILPEKLLKDNPSLLRKFDDIYAIKLADSGVAEKINGPMKRLLNRSAKIMGSDSYRPEELGRFFSWVKMSRPCIEQLETALREQALCIKNQAENPNTAPDIFLNRLSIVSMSHCGRIRERPFELRLHPCFNAIIGGRGSGKSTALESIRIVTRRERELEETSLKKDFDRFMCLAQDNGVMLPETQIRLEISRREKHYRLSWRRDGSGAILEERSTDDGHDDWQSCDAGNLQERFPLSIYSQKQISELASNPRGLIEIIDRTPDVGYGEWKGRWEKTKSRYLQLREQLRGIRLELDGESELRIRLGDVENDLKVYDEKGYKDVLPLYQARGRQKNCFELPSDWATLPADLYSLEERLVMPPFPDGAFEENDETRAELREIYKEATDELEKLRSSVRAFVDSIGQVRERYHERLAKSAWRRSLEESQSRYDELMEEYGDDPQVLSLSAYGSWVEQRSQLQSQLKKTASLRREAQEIAQQIREMRKKLRDLRKELYTKRSDFIRKVIGKSPHVRMELVPFGDVSFLDSEYRTLLALTDGSFESSVLDGGKGNEEGLLARLYNWEKEPRGGKPQAGRTREDCLRSLVAEVKRETLRLARRGEGGLGKRLKKLFDDRPEAKDRLLCWWPEDLLKIKYSKDPQSAKFYDLEKGSAGQKAAAILAFLLSYGQEPLVIDQPEDDLDNTLISDLIVRQIHEHKHNRQLIIVTHNPNVVVNGDAELVHALCYVNGQVFLDRQDGLEEKNIRDTICSVIEGGREALEKRYRRLILTN